MFVLEAARNLDVQHEFSGCRYDTVCIRYKDNLFTKGCNKKSDLSSSQSLAPRLQKYKTDFFYSARPFLFYCFVSNKLFGQFFSTHFL